MQASVGGFSKIICLILAFKTLQQPKTNTMMHLRKSPFLFFCALLAFAFVRCSSTPETANGTTVDSLQTAYQQLQDENTYLKDELNEASYRADSLGSLYHSLQESIEKKPVLTPAEKEFAALVPKVNDALSEMIQSKDTEKVLSYFHDRFTTNVVQVSIANQVNVERGNSSTFPEYLNYLVSDANISSLQFSVRDILELHVRDDQLGIMVFTSNFEVRKKDGEVIKGEELIQVVAKKYDGKWEIGNYSAILLSDYDEMEAI